jgi:hypothetical protein
VRPKENKTQGREAGRKSVGPVKYRPLLLDLKIKM